MSRWPLAKLEDTYGILCLDRQWHGEKLKVWYPEWLAEEFSTISGTCKAPQSRALGRLQLLIRFLARPSECLQNLRSRH